MGVWVEILKLGACGEGRAAREKLASDLPLELEQRDPLQETDQELASHLAAHYPEVKSTSRPVISRRRKRLHDVCSERVIRRLRENFACKKGQAGEQTRPAITHINE
jgi:hypothetical protein